MGARGGAAIDRPSGQSYPLGRGLEARSREAGVAMLSTDSFTFEPNPRPVDQAERGRLIADPLFGRVHSDHMAIVRYSNESGWHDARITARGPIVLDPATSVLHY